ncbi:Os05g0538700, partial [Oryza sativa Japonica Group]
MGITMGHSSCSTTAPLKLSVGLYDSAGDSPPAYDGAALGGCDGARRRRCSWYSTCTTVCTGRRSFCAACAHASRDSFWQSIALQASRPRPRRNSDEP